MSQVNFKVVTLLVEAYPVLTIRVWYQLFRNLPVTSSNILDDNMNGVIDNIITNALRDSLNMETNLTKLKKDSPGVIIVLMN